MMQWLKDTWNSASMPSFNTGVPGRNLMKIPKGGAEFAAYAGAAYYGSSFSDSGVPGAVAGFGGAMIGANLAVHAAADINRGLSIYRRQNAGQLSKNATTALNIGRMVTNSRSRGMLFAAGALLGGGVFSAAFAGTNKSSKRGFNAQRGNSIVR